MAARFIKDRTLATVERIAKLAADCGMALSTFAIAWTLTRDFLGSTLIGATSVEQLAPLLAAADARIPADALAEVDRISREIRYPMG